jgi:quercetin dioxygenase-like cupin family protein
MGKETFKTNYLLQKDYMSSSPSLSLFDLPTLVEKMKNNQSWVNGELHAMVLLKTPNKQIVLTAMHDGTEIQSFQSGDSITFQIIEGKLIFHTRHESVIMEKGQLLTLHENIKYSLTTNEETILLLTIASGVLRLSEN